MGKVVYYLPLVTEDGKYFVDRSQKLRKFKVFRGLPDGMKNILPMVISEGTMQKDTPFCVKVTVTFVREDALTDS